MLTTILGAAAMLGACAASPETASETGGSGALRANVSDPTTSEFQAIQREFERRNPGHALSYRRTTRLSPLPRARVLLVQAGAAKVRYGDERTSDVTVGDVLWLGPLESMAFDATVGLLEFRLPEPPAASVPRVIRPDWDPQITDTPGGCATDEGAYRRVLLTWLDKNGPYTFEGLNVHRVRIDDSFTHYHPLEGGFDEFYLVQAVRPGARILTSSQTARIVEPDSVTRGEVDGLLQSTELRVGDLVYLPRGTAHRGLGGVLAQVITVPGFVPGAEIGLDHHLHAINERLRLTGDDALPLHAAGKDRAIVR